MGDDLARERQQLHQLMDRLAPGQVRALRDLLQVMLDPVSRAVACSGEEEEPLSPEAVQALSEAGAWLRRNNPISHEQVLAELGITPEDVREFKDSV